MDLYGPDFSDSWDPIFSDSRNPRITFVDSRDPNRIPKTPLKTLSKFRKFISKLLCCMVMGRHLGLYIC